MPNTDVVIKLLGQQDTYKGIFAPGVTAYGFTGFQIVRAVDAAADAFAFALPWDPAEYDKIPVRPFLKNTVEIYFKDERILYGYIESIRAGSSVEGRMLELQGRSATGVCLEWSAGAIYDPTGAQPKIKTEFRGMKFSDISRTLFLSGPQGTPAVRAIPDIGPFGDEAVADPSQSLFEFFQGLAETAGYWGVPTADGYLEFKKLGNTAPVVDLEEGKAPLISASASHDSTKRARWYLLSVAQWGTPTAIAAAVDATAEPAIRGTRILAEPQQSAKNYTELVNQARSRAIMDGYSVEALVTGFTYGTGASRHVWKAGDVIRLFAPSAYVLRPTNYIIRRATLQYDETGGETTKLDLVFPELFTGGVRDITAYPFS